MSEIKCSWILYMQHLNGEWVRNFCLFLFWSPHIMLIRNTTHVLATCTIMNILLWFWVLWGPWNLFNEIAFQNTSSRFKMALFIGPNGMPTQLKKNPQFWCHCDGILFIYFIYHFIYCWRLSNVQSKMLNLQ